MIIIIIIYLDTFMPKIQLMKINRNVEQINKLTSLLRKREQDYIEEQLDLNKADMSKSWKVFK